MSISSGPGSGTEQPANAISAANSSTAPLAAGLTFTGSWEDASQYGSAILAVSTDQDASVVIQFSPDGSNIDSALTRYYRTGTINPPHRFTITRQYVRVLVENTSTSDQTYMRLQTVYGDKAELNAPLDSTLSRDFDAVATRPSDYRSEVALGLRQGAALWNKFGYNEDVDSGSAEVVASWGGTFSPMTTARTLSVVSSSAADASGGTGANNIVVYGIDANRAEQTAVVVMNGTTPVVTAETWLGINRISIGLSGSGQVNAGTITATATTDLTIQGQVPAGGGTSQQCIYHVPAGHRALVEWLTLNIQRFGGGTEPVVTLKGWVYSAVSNSKYEVVRLILDASIDAYVELKPPLPFPIGEASTFWVEAESTASNTNVQSRFSLIDTRNASA